jgi:hypothetical protein
LNLPVDRDQKRKGLSGLPQGLFAPFSCRLRLTEAELVDRFSKMPRTSRSGPGASVDALDNIDLDGMFADDGDALFDGLDIDLDNMDDITDGGNVQNENSTTTKAAMPPPQQSEAAAPELTRTRRKTKRKTKTPSFFEDEDDDIFEPPKKRKKTSKAASAAARKKAAKKASEDSVSVKSDKSLTKSKSKAKASVMMPPPSVRASPGQVAAAGQFGGRQKRGDSVTAKQKLAALEAKASKRASSVLGSSMSPSENALATKSSFCGLKPSKTLFYPFMPALPPEPSMKSRKVYPQVDSIYSSFMSQLHSAGKVPGGSEVKQSDPIFQIMQEALKDEKMNPNQDRNEMIRKAVGVVRRDISSLDARRLAEDWYAVCGLLQRQHDFLKRSAENMERWCKDNFSAKDFAAVFLRQDQQSVRTSLLKNFNLRELKVKLICSGFKAAKSLGPLVAALPAPYATPLEKISVKTKRRKVHAIVEPTTLIRPVVPAPPKPAPPVTYATMKPSNRRKQVADLLARTASNLDAVYSLRGDVRRQGLTRQESIVRKLIEEDKIPVIHTSAMWQWLEKSGYFGDLAETEIGWRLDEVRFPDPSITVSNGDRAATKRAISGLASTGDADYSLFDRLQSLLVEEETSDEEFEVTDHSTDEMVVLSVDDGSEMADLSSLSLEERTYIHLRRLGLSGNLVPPPASKAQNVEQEDGPTGIQSTGMLEKSTGSVGDEEVDRGNGASRRVKTDDTDDIVDIIDAMKSDLLQVSRLNNSRAKFLESLSRSSVLHLEGKTEEEAMLISKCQQLLKKSKELKAKNGKAKVADGLALPW